ncbi:tail fiber assembly protein [Salmonella enterica subsp. indica]|uniref:tail fiber assembly protein n=1 Tax=Salmonella enterica TaxID=28901 RepID=UPI0009AAE524|nr:tail fiber assembly protein [Salmonella enterica]EBP3214212.1 tail fiber assembly protein [Salmonella enterica subsp. arizonae]ECI8272099.1 tail fiber assembly protein [Salmonella enterica subsp. enterica]EDR2773609.1 tail fiber assembly protein [Salmonella enterica subsp. enterica serovar Oslo]EEC4251066.1 hypothetical protein [Salmonella enterica subsp. diarizonae]ECC3879342.1 hypothetical protein [Salmonella enterica subsp. indica]
MLGKISEAELQKDTLISQANDYMNSKQWPGKAAMGHLNDNGKVQDNDWLDYLNALDNIDASNAPNITWPLSPQK